MADQFEWQPRVGYWHRYRSVTGRMKTHSDKLGIFYAPLISMDQHWIHPTILFVVDGRDIDPIPAPPYSDYHPTKLSPFEGRYPYVEADE